MTNEQRFEKVLSVIEENWGYDTIIDLHKYVPYNTGEKSDLLKSVAVVIASYIRKGHLNNKIIFKNSGPLTEKDIDKISSYG